MARKNIRTGQAVKVIVIGVAASLGYLVYRKAADTLGIDDPRPLWARLFYTRNEWIAKQIAEGRATATGTETHTAPANPVHGYILTENDKTTGVGWWRPPANLMWVNIRVRGEGVTKMLVNRTHPRSKFPARIQHAVNTGEISFI